MNCDGKDFTLISTTGTSAEAFVDATVLFKPTVWSVPSSIVSTVMGAELLRDFRMLSLLYHGRSEPVRILATKK